MNYCANIFFLVSLSSVSLFIIFLIRVLDLANTSVEQKIKVIKIGLILVGLAPFLFIFLKLFSWKTLEINLSSEIINHSLIHTVPSIFTSSQFHWSFYFFIAYMIGFAMMIFRILFSYFNAKIQLSKSLLSTINGQAVYLTERIQSPLSFGLPIAKIYFPLDAEEKWTPREIQMSITHEKIHLEQNDSLWKLFSLVVVALLFFVPWSYYLHRRLELEMEIFCDMKTCTRTNANINEYGDLLLGMICAEPINLIFTNLTNSNLKKRFLTMKSKTIKRSFLIAVLSTVLLFAGGTVIAMTSGITGKESLFDITSRIFIDGKLVSSPRIISRTNQFASIFISNKSGTDSLRIGLLARDATAPGIKDAIAINFDFQYKNGEEKMHSKPEFVLAPNQEGSIKISSDSNHSYEMQVVAKRR